MDEHIEKNKEVIMTIRTHCLSNSYDYESLSFILKMIGAIPMVGMEITFATLMNRPIIKSRCAFRPKMKL